MRIVSRIPTTLFALCFSLLCNAQSTTLVISQVYGGAGCFPAGCSTYKNDFIEIYNRGASGVSVNGWSVQYADAGSTTWTVASLPNVTVPAGGYLLIAGGFSANGTNALPTPDATGGFFMNATQCKVAIVNSTTALSGGCPASAGIVDLVGIGPTASCYETAPAPTMNNTRSVIRATAGCTETNNNSTDFAFGTPTPRNSATAVNICTSLPVVFTEFSAAYNQHSKEVSLNWTTAQEINSREFHVQRLLNNQQWTTIATIPAAGNSTLPKQYQYTDQHAQNGGNVYRLEQIDYDGRATFSTVQTVKADNVQPLQLYPNPANRFVYINAAVSGNEPIEITIADANGRVVGKVNRSATSVGSIKIDLSGFAKGVYAVRYVSGANTFIEKLVINN